MHKPLLLMTRKKTDKRDFFSLAGFLVDGGFYEVDGGGSKRTHSLGDPGACCAGNVCEMRMTKMHFKGILEWL